MIRDHRLKGTALRDQKNHQRWSHENKAEVIFHAGLMLGTCANRRCVGA
jgi:hypothetical protein